MKRWSIRLFVALVLLVVFYLIKPFPPPLFKTDYSVVVTDEQGKILRVFLNENEQWCLPPRAEDSVPRKLQEAVLLFEDKHFYYHPGFNPASILRAIKQNLSQKRVVSGASTITMQVARLRSANKRNYWSKIKEICQAVKIEVHYTKDEILKLYLDHAPYGANIKGYQAASYRYFEKKPKELSWAEAATLAILPNAPGIIFPSGNNKQVKEKRDRLLSKLLKKGVIDKKIFELAVLEPIPYKIYPFDLAAPHFSRYVKNRYPRQKTIRTTLNLGLQNRVQELTRLHVKKIRNEGIKNAAVLVTETKTGKIKAYVGSQNFFDFDALGQVNGVVAPRSSGSILKPFLYGLSIDEGIIVPKTLIKDVPTYFNAFSPSNADKKFNGIVTAQESLIKSLNVPSVRLLNTYGVYQFYTFLKEAGVTTLFREAEEYGLPLIIGGAEVNLLDMTKLYRGLANRGVFTPIIYRDQDSVMMRTNAQQLISPGACYITLQALRDLKRPGVEYNWRKYQHQKPIAWKTGTSYGHKDAWAIGVLPEWTIAVWVGNFDGEGNPRLSGTVSAGSLLFDILNNLPNKGSYRFNKNYDDFAQINICKKTGFLAGQNCPEKEQVDVPIYMQPLRLCPFHKAVYVDREEKYSVCSYCWGKGYYEKKILSYPPDVLHQLKARGRVLDGTPEHNPSCENRKISKQMTFIYPKDSSYIWIPRDFGGESQKLISKIAHTSPQKNVFWYLDDIYLGNTIGKHSKAIETDAGWHKLLVTDEQGNEEKVQFFIGNRKNQAFPEAKQ